MSWKWLFIGLLIFPWLGNSACGNTSSPETNWSQLLPSPAEPGRVTHFYELANRFSDFDPDLSNEMVAFLMQQTSVVPNDSLVVKCHLLKAKNYKQLELAEKSDEELKQALRIAENAGNNALQTKVLFQMGQLQACQKNYQKALLYFQTAEKLTTDPPDIELVCSIFLGQAEAMIGYNATEEALAATDTAFHLARKHNQPRLLAECYRMYAQLARQHQDLALWRKNLSLALDNLSELPASPMKKDLLAEISQAAFVRGDTLSGIEYLGRSKEMGELLYKQQVNEFRKNYAEIIDLLPTKESTGLLWYVISGVFALLLLIFVVWWWKKLTKARVLILENIHSSEEREKNMKSRLIDFEEAVKQEISLTIQQGEEEIRERQATYPKLEEALEFGKQADYLKDMFLAKLSHEVRSPLTTILGFSAMLETELALMESPELFDYASTITQSGQSLIDLLNNIFDLSLINSNKLELKISTFDIEKLTLDLVHKFENQAVQKGLRIVHPEATIGRMETDKGLLERILTMILDNSVRFTEKGYIKIEAKTNEEKTHAIIQVKDTGVGIDKTYLSDVFEPYRKEKLGYSTLYQGAGLSLPLAKKMMEILGGTIEIESEKGIGTTVFITLPLQYSSVDSLQKETFPSGRPQELSTEKNQRILVIEPDKLNRLLIEKILNKSYSVVAVADKAQGKSLIASERKENRSFDLILLEIPSGANKATFGFIDELKSTFPGLADVGIIALLSESRPELKEDFTRHGVVAIVNKPIIREELQRVIQQTLNKLNQNS